MKEFLDGVLDSMPIIIVAMFGAFIQTLRGHWRGWRNCLLSELTAGFGAFIAGALLKELGFGEGIMLFAAGMIGWSGGALVDRMLHATEHKIGSIDDKETRHND